MIIIAFTEVIVMMIIYYTVAKSDGVYQGKRYFTCPRLHGVIVPINHVHLLVPREV